jgi:pimeloyl-ACP methyl ester carboxylesterase
VARFVLIPGADGRAWYWHRLVPILMERGHEAAAVDLPVTNPAAGLDDYTDAVMTAIGERDGNLVLVAQSLGGFIAPLVADRAPLAMMVLVNAMVPRPGETAGEWWSNTGHEKARAEHYAREGRVLPSEFDPVEAFFNDVPPAVFDQAMAMGEQAVRFDTLFSQLYPLDAWPKTPTRFLQARDDRFLPLEFQRQVVRERLGIEVDEMPGGHLVALSRPVELADRLDAFLLGTATRT